FRYSDHRDLLSFPTRRSSDLTLFAPDGSRAPRSPSPNCTYVFPCSPLRTTYARSDGFASNSVGFSSQRTSFTRTSSAARAPDARSEEHTSELQSLAYRVCRLL